MSASFANGYDVAVERVKSGGACEKVRVAGQAGNMLTSPTTATETATKAPIIHHALI